MLHRVYYLPQLHRQLLLAHRDRIQLQNLLLILHVDSLLVLPYFAQVVTQSLPSPLENLPYIRIDRTLNLLAHLFDTLIVTSALLYLVWQLAA